MALVNLSYNTIPDWSTEGDLPTSRKPDFPKRKSTPSGQTVNRGKQVRQLFLFSWNRGRDRDFQFRNPRKRDSFAQGGARPQSDELNYIIT